ncbi:hypothetical protein ID47_02500 [Candidatus Paracaedibacter acanthamoebae]|uniref:Uncharacterized protein n=2 Tax=Candidatus Odyssella acanthamoebae TaxID=91604 RepID=A0A077AUY4_9PROT|nr:hypothetical protein ID47_02500 [Candidatus Paracaedibacter acanthamoebae]
MIVFKYFKKFSLFIAILLGTNYLQAMEENLDPFKFKIGFEFQEANHLFPAGENNFSIQKKTIFTAVKDNKELWHLEIDGSDIEFVTPPFLPHDTEDLLVSIQSITEACNTLKNLMENKIDKISFREWIEGTNIELTSQEQTLLKQVELRPNLLLNNEVLKNRHAELLKKQEQSLPGLKKIFVERGIELVTDHEDKTYDKIADMYLIINRSWVPKFMPQVTIQHSLKDTIPLLMSLFGSLSEQPTKIENKLIQALPFINDSSKLMESSYLSEENGLLFLHTLTCASIQSSKSDSQQGLINSLHEIKRNFEHYRQVDAKVNASFLSRRPFSSMWADIKEKKQIHSTFQHLYNERIIEGNYFFNNKVVPNFKFVNYAEEFYLTDLSGRRDLSYLKDVLREKLENFPTEPLSFLLNNGIIATALIQYLWPEVFADYLNHTILSIDQPQGRYMFDLNTNEAVWVASDVDALSPPWFLDPDNSMGAYQDKKNFDELYGEAIVEMRSIKDISKDTLHSMNILQDHSGTFLTGAKRSLEEDVFSLLSILKHDFILTTSRKVLEKNM